MLKPNAAQAHPVRQHSEHRDMVFNVRRATAADFSSVRRLYLAWQYSGEVRPEDMIFVAEHDGLLVGVTCGSLLNTTPRCSAACECSPSFSAKGSGPGCSRRRLPLSVQQPATVFLTHIWSGFTAERGSSRSCQVRPQPFWPSGSPAIFNAGAGPITCYAPPWRVGLMGAVLPDCACTCRWAAGSERPLASRSHGAGDAGR